MRMPDANALLLAKLSQRDRVSDAEAGAIGGMTGVIRRFARGDELVAAESDSAMSCLILDGLAARAVTFSNGERQISGLQIRGDFPDLDSFHLQPIEYSVIALSAGRAAFYSHEMLRQVTKDAAHMTRMLWTLSIVDTSIQRRWNACLGRQSAVSHLGHLICELYRRNEVMGLGGGNKFELYLTQFDLADILGITQVHVSRCLAQLRRDKLIDWRKHVVEILDFPRLAVRSHFTPRYLRLDSPSRLH